MKNIFKTSKRSVAAILTLCILLGIAGTCVYAASVTPEENTAVTEGTTQELSPVMARACWATLDDALDYYIGEYKWEYDANGFPYAQGYNFYISNGYCHVTGDDVDFSFRFGY